MLNTTHYQTGKKLAAKVFFLLTLFFFNSAMAWESGYDILTVGKISKYNVLFAYDRDAGRAYKYRLSSAGIGSRQSDKVFKWRKSWTHLDLNQDALLRMFHSGTTGDVQLYKLKQNFGKDKKTKKIKTYSKFYKGFDIVEDIVGGGTMPHYLFYDKEKGYAKIYAYNGVDHNFGAPVYKSKNWHQGWDIIKPLIFDGYSYLLFYDREEGLLSIRKTNNRYRPTGMGEQTYESSEWRHTWHTIIPFADRGSRYLFCYDKTNGVGKIFELDYKKGTVKRLIKEFTGWRKSWDIITIYKVGSKTHILFYDKHGGGTNVYRFASGGDKVLYRIQSK